jgi:hypothetical protein
MSQQLNDYEKLLKRYSTLDEALYYLKFLFPGSFINKNNELILIPETNLYIILSDCQTKLQLFAKVLEWCSRDSCFSLHYMVMKINKLYWKQNRKALNSFFDQNWSHEDMSLIYETLGCRVNHELTIKFIESGFDLQVLERSKH